MLGEINVHINTVMQIKQIAKHKLKFNKQIIKLYNKDILYLNIIHNIKRTLICVNNRYYSLDKHI